MLATHTVGGGHAILFTASRSALVSAACALEGTSMKSIVSVTWRTAMLVGLTLRNEVAAMAARNSFTVVVARLMVLSSFGGEASVSFASVMIV